MTCKVPTVFDQPFGAAGEILTGRMSLKELKWGDGEGVPNPEMRLAEGASGLGREVAK